MGDRQPFSEWIVRTVIAAIFSVVGFLGQDIYSEWKAEKVLAEATLDRLQVLSDLLNESKSIFESQNYMAQRLMQMLLENHAKEMPQEALGYDETFYRMREHFLPAEVELQTIIRSTTINSLRRVNQEMSKWLNTDKVFKSRSQPTREREFLAQQLRTLELHLNQWHDKYEAVIPTDKRRSLVYLADEKSHGIGFPKGIEQVVEKVIDTWR
ncbi:MAG: hypothetical protein JSW39_19780 [Desulfobacterales bacterium]|nr:MAG: hypothetical protein JSW39_19780 [Desulfobacterales bacterium]